MIKTYRYQLLLLSILTFINLYVFYFHQGLSDNALLISSASSDINSINYGFSSLLSYIHYYSGIWVFFALIFSCFSFFWVSKSPKKLDILLPLILTIACFLFFSYIFPSLLGDGLETLASKYITGPFSFLFSIIFFGVYLYILSRGEFFNLLKRLQLKLEGYGQIAFSKISKLRHTKVQKRKSLGVKKPLLPKLSVDLPSLKPIKEKAKEVLSKENRVSVEKKNMPSTESSDLKIETITEEQVKPLVKKNSAVTNYSSSELIGFISSNQSANQVKVAHDYFDTIRDAIEAKLKEFKIFASIINVLKGPVVDTFELELGEGVKLSKVLGVSDDIGLALNGVPIRIVYPLRGRSTIGIEVPRNPREFIYLDEVLKSDSFNDSQYRLPVAMGKDAFGKVKVVDLAGMPHMLVAGATGAGKSVFINALLTSLIIKKSPDELKLILIDPKQLELATFQELPHLLLPVLTDPSSSAVALLWLVQEMDRRYTILKDMGVKNIEGFNRKLESASPAQMSKIAMHYDGSINDYKLPYIVCVIDEFADLILTKMGKEIETNVNRLAAKARAAGIHMVVATQRPSTDVVTGVIKANFPTRVAFRVTTGHDSKTILDQYGSEKLLGRGDMLYKHGVELIRLHSSYVDEDEIEGLVTKLAETPSEYDDQALSFLENGGDQDDSTLNGEVKTYLSGTTQDPIYEEALRIVLDKGSASASMLQRALRVGYNRAANIIEEMERNGVVGPAQGSKPRKVLQRFE